jgi:acetylornithine/succinyldiaminopimelate/putrescine aminotransferase
MTAYGNMDEALAGLAYGCENEVVSRLAGVEIGFGEAVFAPSGNADSVNKTQGAGLLLGVAIRTDKRPGKYEVGDAVNIMGEGLVWVPTADAVVAQAPAYLTTAGAWTDEASGNFATGYKFRKGTAAAGLALLEVIK